MRILSSILLVIVGVLLTISVIAYNAGDLEFSDWFLPAPHPVDNPVGPFGAWIALRLHYLGGYFSAIVGLFFVFLGVARFFRWTFPGILKVTMYALGWFLVLAAWGSV